MKQLLTLLILIVFYCSCDNNLNREYYSNGNIKKEYFLKNGLLDSTYKIYYSNSNLAELHMYKEGDKVDSSVYYYPKKGVIKQKTYWTPYSNYNFYYNEYGYKIKEGRLDDSLKHRLGKWKFYLAKVDSVVEYKYINGGSYVNQIWLIKKSSDTIKNKGNYYSITLKDTVEIGEIIRVRLYLNEPFYGNNSDIELILPYNDDELASDYSNIYSIKRDTFPSLKNDGIPHPEIPESITTEHYIEFGLKYETSGEKRIRGVLLEYQNYNKQKINIPDSIKRIERRLYIDKTVFIKNYKKSLPSN